MSDAGHKHNKCPGGGMADAEDSKSFVGNNVGVQVPSRAPDKNLQYSVGFYF